MNKKMFEWKLSVMACSSYLAVAVLLSNFLAATGSGTWTARHIRGEKLAESGRLKLLHRHSVEDDGPPSPRAGHGMDAWDMYVGDVYLFGGCVNMSNTGPYASLAMLRGCTEFSNEVWKMYWDEHSGQISWWRLFRQPNATTSSQEWSGDATYASARAGSSVLGFDRPNSGSGVTTLFIFGGVGSQNGHTLADTWFFDTERQHWITVNSTAPPHRAYHSTVHWKDLMIVFGGLQVTTGSVPQFAFRSDVIVFNTTEGKWYMAQSKAQAANSPSWTLDGKLITNPQKLEYDDPLPGSRAYHAACLHGSFANTMFMYGGAGGTGRNYQDVFFEDLWTMTWADSTSLLRGEIKWTKLLPAVTTIKPPPLFGHTMAWCNSSELVMLWGMTSNHSAPGGASGVRKAWRLDLKNMQWRAPTGRYEAGRGMFAFVPIGCGGWLSDGVAQFGNEPKLLSDFSDSGIIPLP